MSRTWLLIVLFFITPMASGEQTDVGAWTIDLFNVDDLVVVTINGSEIGRASYGEAKKFDLNRYMHIGKNDLAIKVYNGDCCRNWRPWRYGYTLKRDGSIIVTDSCGDIRTTVGCRNGDQTAGLVFEANHSIVLDPPPVLLELVRSTSWTEYLMPTPQGFELREGGCVAGKLYMVYWFSTPRDHGWEIADTLELPWRNNIKGISSIPAGVYRGYVRKDGARGFRIELEGTEPRTFVQIHLGNYPKDTEGCILVGKKAPGCALTDSRAAVKELERFCTYNGYDRPIRLRVTDGSTTRTTR